MCVLTYERVSELLHYDEETGKIYWKVRPSKNVHIGDEAGSLKRSGRNTYRYIQIDRKKYLAHRIAWLLYYENWPQNQIDHLDGNGLNNTPENMREATNQDNAKNQRMRNNNSSGVTGVCWKKARGKWHAQINIDGKRKSLGYFADFDEAAETYRKAADALGFSDRHGEGE